MIKVPFLDVGASYRELRSEIDESIRRVLDGGQYIAGHEVEAFEEDFAEYVGTDYCIGVGNGLDALYLSLIANGIGPGDEVIVPSHTFVATWLAVSRAGATIVTVDTEQDGFNLDLDQVEQAISPKTRAVIPVHLYGVPVDLYRLSRILGKREIIVIDDAAQACGSSIGPYRIGSSKLPSHCTAWSFYPGKNLGAIGDAGAITTCDRQLAEKLRLLRNYGSRKKYNHEIQGINSRLDPIQAAVLRVKLPQLSQWNERRRDLGAIYRRELAPVFQLREPPEGLDSNLHLFVIESQNRSELISWIAARSIEVGIHYPVPPHRQGAYSSFREEIPTFRTNYLSDTVISLPIGPHLSTSNVAYVSSVILEFMSHVGSTE